ncbi:hypothetical protein Taro_047563 [Colocasia esculenta]|uniref:Uncharacterized protein n=1 Tax=Colocasia esculenta TaxID=4460 RepID=A0A843WWG1_COLES|nr:hypothetical protein [Colocasia esculenta]
MKWFNKEMGSMKSMLSEILKVVGAQAPLPPPAQPSKGNEEGVARPSGPSDQESGPSGPKIVSQTAVVEYGPSGPEIVSLAAAVESGPSGPSDQGSGPVGFEQILAEEAAVALEPPSPSPTQTPAPSSPLSASTAPPAPQPFKQPQPRTISSPTPFPTHSSSPPVSHISPPPPLSEVPPTSSAGASSSSGPSFFGPSKPISSTPHSLLHPNPPPSFITIIPKGAQIDGPYLRAIKDEFEVAILRSVLKVGEHIHVTDSSSPVHKKRKTSSSSNSSSVLFPPMDHTLTLSEWFLIHHKDSWAPFIQKEIKMIRYFKMFNDYRYLHRLPEVQLGQFRVMGRIKVQKGYLMAFHRFLFREYHQGHVSAEVLAPALSECERLNPKDWIRFYPLSAQQLSDLNESRARLCLCYDEGRKMTVVALSWKFSASVPYILRVVSLVCRPARPRRLRSASSPWCAVRPVHAVLVVVVSLVCRPRSPRCLPGVPSDPSAPSPSSRRLRSHWCAVCAVSIDVVSLSLVCAVRGVSLNPTVPTNDGRQTLTGEENGRMEAKQELGLRAACVRGWVSLLFRVVF